MVSERQLAANRRNTRLSTCTVAPRSPTSRQRVIKLDVEGAESDVLRGAEDTLRRNPSAFLLFEASGGGPGWVAATLETLELLEARGYRFRRLTGRRLAPPVGSDALLPLIRSPHWYDNVFNVVAVRLPDQAPT